MSSKFEIDDEPSMDESIEFQHCSSTDRRFYARLLLLTLIVKHSIIYRINRLEHDPGCDRNKKKP
jgi:hypothetical protein